MNSEELMLNVDRLLDFKERPTWQDKSRILRKLIEESGEYCEALEYESGSSGKVKKFKGKATVQEKLHEEVCDVAMMALALAHHEGLLLKDVLEKICKKLEEKETQFLKDRKA